MANEKWSAFPNVGATTTGDIIVGLRTGANVQFTSPIGTVNAGTINDLAYYAASGTAISALATANNGVLITSNSGVPSLLANSGTPGFVLTANTAAPPSWQAVSASGAITTINGNAGSVTPTAGAITINGGTTGLTTSGAGSTLSITGTLLIANGGTSVTSVTTSPTASAWAGWNSNANLSADSFIPGFLSTATNSGTLTLTVDSKYVQELTGTLTETVTLPVTSTLVVGQGYYIINNSSGAVTVNSSGGNLVQLMAANSSLYLTCLSISLTTAAAWQASYLIDGGASGIVSPGTQNQMAWYAATGSTVSGLSTANNGLLVTSAGGVPSIGNAIGADITVNGIRIGLGNSSINTNTGVGTSTLNAITTGNHNTGLGFQTLQSITTGADNTGIGYNAVGSNGNGNTGLGSLALNIASGDDNTGIGISSLASLTTGQFNTAVGGFTGLNLGGAITLATGNNNTLLGLAAGVDDAAATGTIALGYLAVGNISTGVTAGDNGPGITIGSTGGPVGFRGDGTIYSGGTGRGYWRPNLNGTHYLMPCFIDGTLTANAAMLTDNNGSPILSASMSAGQILIGTTGGPATVAAINSGPGILVANGSGSITISATGGGVGWNAAASTPITAAVNSGYYITNSSQVTITLPAVAAAGSVISIAGTGTGGWILQPGAGQTIQVLTATAAVSITSAERYDCIQVLCTVANTTWVALNMVTTGFTIS